ncbi:hypothetical protein [Nocardioides pocheonensis]|uniref:Lipoprotein n=1 Tax=Nocardioides pocheonensis TaxID=661485 RepID=A0A3N0GJN0_9ACTN|nr:hypothetical protein [Nocardioides pocheonensis]RNM12675.1 hypothetical protein EFL26_18920 [Nocardioides pocheonensis]
MFAIRSVLACAAVVALVAGCGSESGQRQEPLTAAQFRMKAQSICRDASSATKRIVANVGDKPTKAQVKQLVATTVVVVRNEIEDLDRLVPPRELQDDVDAMLDSARRGNEQLRTHGMQMLLKGKEPFKDADKKSLAIGLDDCAK